MIHKNLFKIGDFGLIKILDKNVMQISVKGTPLYIAPELLINDEIHSNKVDMYSLGVVLY